MITFDKLDSQLMPLGFLLTKDRLVTVRFHELRAFGEVRKRIDAGDGVGTTSIEIFLLLMEELVDSLADALEDMGADLDSLSTRIFDFDVHSGGLAGDSKLRNQTPRRRDLALRRILRGIGRRGKALGKIRSSLLGLERIVPFVANECEQILGEEQVPRFEAVRRDIASLDEFEIRLSENVQFPPRRDARPHQHRAEQHLPGPHRGLGGGHPADPHRLDVRHELQAHAGTRMGLRLSLWPRAHPGERHHSGRFLPDSRLAVSG